MLSLFFFCVFYLRIISKNKGEIVHSRNSAEAIKQCQGRSSPNGQNSVTASLPRFLPRQKKETEEKGNGYKRLVVSTVTRPRPI